MKKILRYGRHLVRARGRHGTHSPFVYAFVEQVMRASATGVSPRSLPGRRGRLLYYTIQYLSPDCIYVTDDLRIPVSEAIISPGSTAGIPLLPVPEDGMPGANSLLIASCTAGNATLLNELRQRACSGQRLLLFAPHDNKESRSLWEQLCTDERVQLSLDCWYWGLLVWDDAFKAKQHFRIR